MDECVRLEEALQAEELRKAEQEQSPRRLPVRRRSAWPFSLEDFGKTDEIRLPPVSPELAAFSPGPPEASPRRRGTNPSSPRTPQRSDNRNDPSQSSPRSPKRRIETTVEQVPSCTESRTREDRKAIYSTRSTPKHRDRHREATPQSPALPGAASLTDLRRLRDSENPRRRYSMPIAPQTKTDTQANRDGERPTVIDSAARGRGTASSDLLILTSEPKPERTTEIIDILRKQGTRRRVHPGSRDIKNIGVKFRAKCTAYVMGEFDTDPRQGGTLLMMEIATEFPRKTDQSQHSIRMSFNYATEPKTPGPKIFKMATYALDKGHPQTEREGERVDTSVKNDGDSAVNLKLKNCMSRAVVTHVALILQHSGDEPTGDFCAGVEFHGISVELDGSSIQRMLDSGEDIKLTFKAGKPEPHETLPVLDDVDLHRLLLSWVKAG